MHVYLCATSDHNFLHDSASFSPVLAACAKTSAPIATCLVRVVMGAAHKQVSSVQARASHVHSSAARSLYGYT